MKQKAYAVLLVITLGLSNLVYSQSRIDSLKTLLKSAKDTNEIILLKKLSSEYDKLWDGRNMIPIALKGYDRSVKISYKYGEVDALDHLSRAYFLLNIYDSAIYYSEKAITICSKLNYKKGLANSYNSLGNVYQYMGQYEKSIQSHFNALKLREEIGEKMPVSDSYFSIGNNYKLLGRNDKGLDYHLKALQKRLEVGADHSRIAASYGSIAGFYIVMNDYDKAIEFQMKAMQTYEKSGDQRGMGAVYYSIGETYGIKGEYEKSLNYFKKALETDGITEWKENLATIYYSMGWDYFRMKDNKNALTYLLKAQKVADEIGEKTILSSVKQQLSDVYKETKQFQLAYEKRIEYENIKDSLFTVENTKSITELEGKYNTTKKEKEILILNQEKEKKAAQDLADKKQRQIIYASLIVFSFFALVLAYVMFNNYRQKQKARTEAIEKEKVKAELSLLKNQISPHVMFNSLNSIYFQMDESMENSKEMLLQFADLLRYQLYECNVEFTPIEKEIEYMNKFVGIQKLRKSDRCKISFIVAPEVKNFVVAPLLMIPLVENTFKYVTNDKNSENFISILLTKNGNKMEFTTENTIYVDENDTDKKIHKGGIGLTNLKNRLNLIYPKKHELSISKENNIFKTKLVLYV